MKKILILCLLLDSFTYAQDTTQCPFAPQQYVHYDGRIESNSTFIPNSYDQLLANNSAYNRPNSYTDHAAKATCFYKTSEHNKGLIKKPFVFVEGISFEKAMANGNTYTKEEYFRQGFYPDPVNPYLNACLYSEPQYNGEVVGYSTFNWATLVTGIDAEGQAIGNPLHVENAPKLLNKLCCAGYDICFVDFFSGEEYIESNGEALYTILVKLHNELVANNSDEKMVVCGASMGGLVARYAINKLEQEGKTDWVESFISFDSPQMGANIPLSVQYTLKNLKNVNGELEGKYNKLVCPSASQLVNYSCLETNMLSPLTFTIPSPSIERTALLQHDLMGWPQHCKKIAISNGSRLGTQQTPLTPGDKVLDIDGFLDLDLFSLPLNQSSWEKIFDFDPAMCLATTGLYPLSLLTQKSVRVKETMALDLAAGSYRTDLLDIKNEMPDIVNSYPGQLNNLCTLNWMDNTNNNNNRLCFIPITSSLGIINFENIMKYPASFSNVFLSYLFNGGYRFEDYSHQFSHFDVAYAPVENQTHVEITNENIEWVMHEITSMTENIFFENTFLLSNTFRASNTIIAGNGMAYGFPCSTGNFNGPPGGNIPPGQLQCGEVISASNNTVSLEAGEYIDLRPGFFTDSDAYFDAKIISVQHCTANRLHGTTNKQTTMYSSQTSRKNIPTARQEIYINDNQSLSFITVKPNPSVRATTVESTDMIQSVQLFSMQGNMLLKQLSINSYSYLLETEHLAQGVYLLSIETKSGNKNIRLLVGDF